MTARQQRALQASEWGSMRARDGVNLFKDMALLRHNTPAISPQQRDGYFQ